MNDDDFDMLKGSLVPPPGEAAKARAFASAMQAFDTAEKKLLVATQGMNTGQRLTSKARELWREMMQRKLISAPAITGLIALPIAGYAAWQITGENNGPFHDTSLDGPRQTEIAPDKPVARAEQHTLKLKKEASEAESNSNGALVPPKTAADSSAALAPLRSDKDVMAPTPPLPMNEVAPAPPEPAAAGGVVEADSMSRMAPGAMKQMAAPADQPAMQEPSQNRLEKFDSNPVKSVLNDPVSTFSIDVDTASYSFVRRSLKDGALPDPDNVRVEEMINYFPYDWKGPDSASTPFNSTITVMPTPWNEHTKLMHIAIKGYDVKPVERPHANLVFLVDVSGSMDEPDKLPLLKSAFRLLVNKLDASDTVSIVTYAGNAGVALEPTKGSDRAKILSALDNLEAGGSTAGEAGIREAYALAKQSFVNGGVNRVMLATDGDFNVGESDDDDLKKLIENERKDGIFLSVFGFGNDNYNDQLMQVLAQNGNGQAAYIDTLSEAEKALVEESSSTLFPIAKDVKIQVEFNPAKVSEYRLIGYETRALKREDFNNDRVDAGDIGSGHAVTAIYEITPKGSPAQSVDDLRYQKKQAASADQTDSGEYAFVKIRYKLPNEDTSKLISTPVTAANEVASFDKAGDDQRFSIAVAAFGQKLRNEDATAGFDYDRISRIATAARGADPYGYRAEFLSLVRLASALDGGRR